MSLLVVLCLPALARGQTFSASARRQLPNARTAEFTSPQRTVEAGSWNGVECDCTSISSGCCEEALRNQACGDCTWLYGEAAAMVLARSNESAPGSVVESQPGSSRLISTGDFDFDGQVGAKFLLGCYVSDCSAIEFAYFGLQDWNSSVAANGADNLNLPGGLGLASQDFFDADSMRVDYSSKLHNLEASLVRHYGWFTLVGGFRYLELDEELNINSIDLGSASDYNIATQNRLYGGQVGARLDGQFRYLSWDVTGKLGAFGNASRQATLVGDLDNTLVLRDSLASDNRGTFVGDIEVAASYPLLCGLSIRGGVNFLWIDGISLAPDQLDFSNVPGGGTDLRNSGGVFYYGGTLGLEGRW